MTARYRRVPQTEPEEDEEKNKKLQAQRVDKISAKIHAAIWVALAGLLAHFTGTVNLLFSDRINRFAFSLALCGASAIVVIFLYLGFWLPVIMRNHTPWNIYCPNLVPTAAGLSVVSFIAFIVAFWPVWGLLSPFFVTFLMMGVVFSAHFIPWPF